MRDMNGEPAFDDRHPDREPTVEAGPEASDQGTCLINRTDGPLGVVASCGFKGRCVVKSQVEQVYDVATGESTQERTLILGDQCVARKCGGVAMGAEVQVQGLIVEM